MNKARKIFHGEAPKRDWPNLRRSHSSYCREIGLPFPVRPSLQYPKYQKKYRAEHREALNDSAAARKRLRRKLFPEKMRASQRRERRTPETRIRSNLSRRINKALKGVCKSARTISLVGCSIAEFKARLGALFKPGMTWENYGPVWHIDHIKPCAKFDLTDPEQQKLCFHWSNQQPLFAVENIRKGARYVNAN